MDLLDYCLFRYWQEEGDPRTAHFFLMRGGPLPMLSIIACYVCFVKVVGPALMKKREPFRLKRTLIAYNIYNVLVNVWFFAEACFWYLLYFCVQHFGLISNYLFINSFEPRLWAQAL